MDITIKSVFIKYLAFKKKNVYKKGTQINACMLILLLILRTNSVKCLRDMTKCLV